MELWRRACLTVGPMLTMFDVLNNTAFAASSKDVNVTVLVAFPLIAIVGTCVTLVGMSRTKSHKTEATHEIDKSKSRILQSRTERRR